MTREGKRIRTEHIEFRWSASLLLHPRVGFIVPKYNRDSVERNRLKRRLREAVRTEILSHLPPVDVILRARPVAYHAAWETLREEVTDAGRRLCALVEGG